MMNPYSVLALVLLAYMTAWFVLSLIKKRNDVADSAWGLGFVLLSWTSLFLSQTPNSRGLLVTLLVSVWGIRLAWHIHSRNKRKAEDYRYAAWREQWGKWFYLRSYAQVYVLQGFLLFVIVSPVVLMNLRVGNAFGVLDFLGIAVWVCGFFFEAVGDAQLKKFLSNPANKGKLMQSGLWAYTRHPNYFGEVTQWWGIWIMALSIGGELWTIVSPITITFLILKVSGVPMLEKNMASHPDFAGYKKRVSQFFPLPPKKNIT